MDREEDYDGRGEPMTPEQEEIWQRSIRWVKFMKGNHNRKLGEFNEITLVVDAELQALRATIREIERHCPCGARPEDPGAFPHAPGCSVGRAMEIIGR